MKRYVLAGAGARGAYMFAKPLVNEYAHVGSLAGIFDINAGRARDLGLECGGVPVYEDFDGMLRAERPDAVIVATVDRYHHEYAIRAMETGCDVISEKPMTVNAENCRAILDAERRTLRKVTVTFNMRYMPYMALAKELLHRGAVGTAFNVDLEWFLDTSHGADYFRRWHRRLANSGGLLVHKATHHFDLVNWWLEDEPTEVRAFGDLRFYGPTRRERGERCLTCAYQKSCCFYFDLPADETCSRLYYRHEALDGYVRDKCVFSDEIDIYDTMSVQVRYQNGADLSYSLVAYSPYEGWRATITGTDGRMELGEVYSGAGQGQLPITVYDRRGGRECYEAGNTSGSHGGGDSRLQKMLFEGGLPDPLGQQADSRAGAMSVLIGASANQSIETGLPCAIASLPERS